MKLLALTGFGLGLYVIFEKEVARVRWQIAYRYSRDGRLVAAMAGRRLSPMQRMVRHVQLQIDFADDGSARPDARDAGPGGL